MALSSNRLGFEHDFRRLIIVGHQSGITVNEPLRERHRHRRRQERHHNHGTEGRCRNDTRGEHNVQHDDFHHTLRVHEDPEDSTLAEGAAEAHDRNQRPEELADRRGDGHDAEADDQSRREAAELEIGPETSRNKEEGNKRLENDEADLLFEPVRKIDRFGSACDPDVLRHNRPSQEAAEKIMDPDPVGDPAGQPSHRQNEGELAVAGIAPVDEPVMAQGVADEGPDDEEHDGHKQRRHAERPPDLAETTGAVVDGKNHRDENPEEQVIDRRVGDSSLSDLGRRHSHMQENRRQNGQGRHRAADGHRQNERHRTNTVADQFRMGRAEPQ